ncbi:DUF2489 domain-containing protein [Bacteriovorax sp. Seq25_V]|uniref:DUF2489 domain-containing protein n=1 Tax=Bacteriovorax sp. Seq25_V TaxID=1201288 RepID=UPI000389E838|nr:DUF2489 domain-containing protein [Bacteriovorax sp. Seq25_V]EQC45722.1 PF10675 family protein [Bacteriovorax sp. Seq25_V]
MTQNEFYIYSAILVVIIFALSIAVSFYYVKLQKIKKVRDEYVKELQKNEQERHDYIFDSIRTICMAYTQDQVEASEACIRLRMLIDRNELIENEKYPTIFAMYEKLKHFKTHEVRNALSSKEKFAEDKERYQVEEDFKELFAHECKLLLEEVNS